MRLVLASVFVVVSLGLAGGSGAAASCPGDPGLGVVAWASGGALRVLELGDCSVRALVARAADGPVRFSADDRYVAFSGGVVATDGGAVSRRLRSAVLAPRGHTLARITRREGVALGGPGIRDRVLLADGFGARALAFDPAGR